MPETVDDHFERIQVAAARLHYHLSLAASCALHVNVHQAERQMEQATDALAELKKAYGVG